MIVERLLNCCRRDGLFLATVGSVAQKEGNYAVRITDRSVLFEMCRRGMAEASRPAVYSFVWAGNSLPIYIGTSVPYPVIFNCHVACKQPTWSYVWRGSPQALVPDRLLCDNSFANSFPGRVWTRLDSTRHPEHPARHAVV